MTYTTLTRNKLAVKRYKALLILSQIKLSTHQMLRSITNGFNRRTKK